MTAVEGFETLGERLARLAQRMAARRVPRLSWLGPLAAMLDHLAARPTPTTDRYARIEAPVGALSLVDEAGPRPVLADDGLAARAPRPEREAPPVPGLPIPPAVRARLDARLGGGAAAARVHTGAVADRVARARRADAVTVGPDIYFRHGAYRPHDDRGFALLTHEVVHVLRAMSPDAAWRRATARGAADEERLADTAEAEALRDRGHGPASPMTPERRSMAPLIAPDVPPPPVRPAAPLAAAPAHPAAAAGPRAMAASVDRRVDPSPAPASAALDLDEMRRAIYRDLMRQLKTDFERGG